MNFMLFLVPLSMEEQAEEVWVGLPQRVLENSPLLGATKEMDASQRQTHPRWSITE
jgi:hypothetical protein